jgi:hypothetical protein
MIIKNILPNYLKEEIYSLFMGCYMPWFWNDTATASKDEIDSDEETFQFIHLFYSENKILSDKYNLVLPILWFFEKETNIKIKNIIRIKANLNTRYLMTDKDKLDAIHKDSPNENFLSIIYYVNDSDGDTLIYDEKGNVAHTITPQANSLIYFKSNTEHAGIFPLINKKRIVINFVVELE